MSNFMKIRPVGAELFHADGRTGGHDTTKLIITFRNFVKATKNWRQFYLRFLEKIQCF